MAGAAPPPKAEAQCTCWMCSVSEASVRKPMEHWLQKKAWFPSAAHTSKRQRQRRAGARGAGRREHAPRVVEAAMTPPGRQCDTRMCSCSELMSANMSGQ